MESFEINFFFLICRNDEQLAVLQSPVKAEVVGVAVKTELGSWNKIVQQKSSSNFYSQYAYELSQNEGIC